MILKSIELCNFRNYKREIFKFHPGTNVLYGDNAQGKTNVLEAIFVGGTTKSHRGSKDAEMIRKGQRDAHLRYFVEKRNRTIKVEIHMKKERSKGIAIDGLPIKNSNELMGISNIIFFSPEDLGIIKDGPEKRRRFMDMELCQLNKAYLFYLKQYKKVLKQRNALLKQTKSRQHLREALDVWDIQLVDYGRKIIQIREEFINELQFLTQGEDLRKYGSQGQKRTAALSLKMAEIQIVEEAIGEKPILLLDDVLSELDRSRQNYLLENIKGIQTIITCTGLEEFVTNGINIDQKFEIVNGGIQHG